MVLIMQHNAVSHTKRQVDALRKKGIRVSSYFVEDSSWHRESLARMFKNMYGKDSQFINVDNIHEVAKTMNKSFLRKCNLGVDFIINFIGFKNNDRRRLKVATNSITKK